MCPLHSMQLITQQLSQMPSWCLYITAEGAILQLSYRIKKYKKNYCLADPTSDTKCKNLPLGPPYFRVPIMSWVIYPVCTKDLTIKFQTRNFIKNIQMPHTLSVYR